MGRQEGPHIMRNTRRLVAAFAAMALFAAACGSDGGEDTTAGEGDETTAPATGDGENEADTGGETDAGGEGDTGGESAAGGGIDVEAMIAAGTDCEPPSGEPLKIGYAADLSEVGGYADKPGSEAAQFAAELLNCAGGIDGTPVEVTVQNIQGDPDVTQRAAQDLLDDGVHAILGPPFSDFGLPLLQITAGQVPVVFVASTEALLSDPETGAFLMAFDDPAQATAAAQFATGDLGAETAVTLSSSDAPYFQQNPEMFAEEFTAQGGEHLGDYTFSLEDSDFSTQVNQIAALDPQPDVVYTAMIMPQTGTLLGQLRSAGIEADVIGADSFDATEVVGAGDVAEGVYYTTHAFPEEGSTTAAFLDAFEEANGRELETVSLGVLAADAVVLIADAYRRAGALDAQAIGEQIAATEDLQVVTGSVTYDGSGTPTKPVFIHQIVDGEATLATTITP